MRRMKSLVAMAILAAVVGLSTPSAFAADGIYHGDRAATVNAGIYLGDYASGIIFSVTGIYLGDHAAAANAGIYLGD